jgi:hypothetical protein
MKYMRVGPVGAERPVAYTGERHYDLSGVTADIDGAFLAAGGLDGAGFAVETLPEIDGLGGQRSTLKDAP